MVLSEYALRHPGFDFGVLATDISTDVLDRAERAVFKQESVAAVPADLRRKYFMRSRNPGSGTLRVVPELREQIEFRRMNFMDADLRVEPRPEIIFCRNVIIYFDRATQERTAGEADRGPGAGRIFFRRPFRILAGDGSAARAGRPGSLQKDRKMIRAAVLPAHGSSPGGAAHLRGSRPFLRRSSAPAWPLCSGARGWVRAQCATASCLVLPNVDVGRRVPLRGLRDPLSGADISMRWVRGARISR